MMGYEPGITVSTASVLLSRAAKKLRARSRTALIAAYEGGSKRAAKSA
jgi:DNA-binding CsgD family transcriptional regulator